MLAEIGPVERVVGRVAGLWNENGFSVRRCLETPAIECGIVQDVAFVTAVIEVAWRDFCGTGNGVGVSNLCFLWIHCDLNEAVYTRNGLVNNNVNCQLCSELSGRVSMRCCGRVQSKEPEIQSISCSQTGRPDIQVMHQPRRFPRRPRFPAIVLVKGSLALLTRCLPISRPVGAVDLRRRSALTGSSSRSDAGSRRVMEGR